MKKLLFTIAISMVLNSVLAQKNFNTITFSKFLTTTGSPSPLNQGIFAIKGSVNNTKVEGTDKPGTINISVAESTVTVKCDGEVDKVFKIVTINKETKEQYKSLRLSITCKDNTGADYSLIITRTKFSKEVNQMNVAIVQINGDGFNYTCTYLKDLFEN